MARNPWRTIPERLRGIEFVHPSLYPWFTAGALLLGIPATLSRPVGSWVALCAGVAFVIVGAFILWFAGRTGGKSRSSTALVLIVHIIVIAVASVLVETMNPNSSYSADPNIQSANLTLAATAFLTACLFIVWVLMWVLVAVLVSAQRSFRSTRRSLRMALARVGSAAEQFRETVTAPMTSLRSSVATQILKRVNLIERSWQTSSRTDRTEAREQFVSLLDEVVVPALTELRDLNFDEDFRPTSVPKPPRIANPGRSKSQEGARTRLRWNGHYFSGLVGGLVIGIVAIASSANVNLTSPGFLLQIPLIVIAFFLSVPSALLLFFAAALTPFLGPNSGAPENFALFGVIVLLALLSLAHRANEVRQFRVLEGLSIANNILARELVDFRQQTRLRHKQLNSVLHGKLQTILIAAQVSLTNKKDIAPQQIEHIIAALRDATSELAHEIPSPPLDFASSIADVVELWDGSVRVGVHVSTDAERILTRDAQATAIVIDVISEGTLNAAKHTESKEVDARITAEGQRVRVTVTNPNSSQAEAPGWSTRLGLDYLSELTTELRLEIGTNSTTLIAELTTSVVLTETREAEY